MLADDELKDLVLSPRDQAALMLSMGESMDMPFKVASDAALQALSEQREDAEWCRLWAKQCRLTEGQTEGQQETSMAFTWNGVDDKPPVESYGRHSGHRREEVGGKTFDGENMTNPNKPANTFDEVEARFAEGEDDVPALILGKRVTFHKGFATWNHSEEPDGRTRYTTTFHTQEAEFAPL